MSDGSTHTLQISPHRAAASGCISWKSSDSGPAHLKLPTCWCLLMCAPEAWGEWVNHTIHTHVMEH